MSATLHNLYFANRSRRWKLYFLAIVVLFLYGVVNNTMLNRPVARVGVEAAILAALMGILLPAAILMRKFTTVAAVKELAIRQEDDPARVHKANSYSISSPERAISAAEQSIAKGAAKVLLICRDPIRTLICNEILREAGYVVHDARDWNVVDQGIEHEHFNFVVADHSPEHLKEPLSSILGSMPIILIPNAKEDQFTAFMQQILKLQGDVDKPHLILGLGLSQEKTVFVPSAVDRAADAHEASEKEASKYSYGYVGTKDFTMYPLLQPGTLVQIDEGRTRVQRGLWHSELERPIYFVKTPEGFVCCWCLIERGKIILQPHPLSSVPLRILNYPQEAEVIGQVVSVAMRLPEGTAAVKRTDTSNVAVGRGAIEEKIAAIFAEVFDVHHLDSNANLAEICGDSPRTAALVQRINERFGADLSLEQFAEISTISQLAELISGSVEKNAKDVIGVHPHTERA